MDTTSSEPRYTLEQARRIIKIQECGAYGHDIVKRASWIGFTHWYCKNECGVIVELRYPDE